MSDETKPTTRSPQRRVGSFILLEKLGAGGIGEVWKARDHRLNRVVALKFILDDTQRSPDDLLREARAASALNHPNIVTILEIGESEGDTYIAMEFVEGETLRKRIDKIGASFETTLDVVSQMAKGLSAAHESGIVHRDIKPENVMIRIDGYVKLVDFGFAKVLPWSEGASSDPTQSGQITGTFRYMSPEQARGQKIEPSSDVFSFGIVLYELLTGEHPFQAGTPIDTLHRIINDEPVSTRVRCPEAPEALHEVVDRCLKKDKTERFQSASELEAHLRSVSGVTPVQHRRERRRKRWYGLILVPILALVLWLWNPFSKPPAPGIAVHSVAVMNLTTPTGDPVAAVIAQGLSDELGGALTREGFQVPARSRIQAIPETADAQTVGKQLNVDAVLEGNVTNANDIYRVYIELVDPKTGFQIWSRLSTTSQSDVLSSNPNTADEIARQLHSAVGGR